MRFSLILLFALSVASAQAQQATPAPLPEKAALKLEKMLKQTQAALVVGQRADKLPAEARPMLNKILAQSAVDFLAISAQKPTKEAYYQCVDSGLLRLIPLVASVEDRQQLAEYYQDLLDIVGVESSEGRLTAFVESSPKKD